MRHKVKVKALCVVSSLHYVMGTSWCSCLYKSKSTGPSQLLLLHGSCSRVTLNQHRNIQMKFPLPVDTFPVCTIMARCFDPVLSLLRASSSSLNATVGDFTPTGHSTSCVFFFKHNNLKKTNTLVQQVITSLNQICHRLESFGFYRSSLLNIKHRNATALQHKLAH